MIESCAITDSGGRAENQDRLLADERLGLFAVADGMGGHRAGSLAAELAISALRNYVVLSNGGTNGAWPFGYSDDVSVQGNRLSTGIRLAHSSVRRESATSPECSGMGTTMAAVLVHDHATAVANVGDSRVYLFRDGVLSQLTQDDTISESDFGSLITDEEFRRQMRNVLVQAVGAQTEINVHVREQGTQPGDLFLLTSDGLHGTLEDESIGAILRKGSNVKELAGELIQAAIERGTSDNVSVILLACSPEE